MALSREICGILVVGAQKERASHDFYLHAASRTRHPMGKKMFERLAKDETRHEQLIQNWANEGVCPVATELPPLDPAFIKKGKAVIEEAVSAASDDMDAIRLGQEMERKSIMFYQDAANRSVDGESRALFIRLWEEEDKHLAMLADLYDYLVNPELWSVRNERANFDS
jgi:rubrerythrin